jgi:type III secretion protein K
MEPGFRTAKVMFDSAIDQLLYDFNVKPAGYVHESWLPANVAAEWPSLLGSRSNKTRDLLSLWVIEYFQLVDNFDFDFSAVEKRVLLLDPLSLHKTAQLLGLAAVRYELKTRISRKDLSALKSALGEADYCFFREHILTWPNVLNYPGFSFDGSKLCDQATRIGVEILMSCMKSVAPQSVRRALLKVPQAHASDVDASALSEEQHQSVVNFCTNCVIRGKFPQWHWLF